MFGHGKGRGCGHRFGHGQADALEDLGISPGSELGRRHGWGARHMGRLFAHGALPLLSLHLIAEKPRHGYEIIKVVAEMVGGAYTPSPGTIYPALTMLEEEGFVTAETVEGGKKRYTVTQAGTTYLAESRGEVEALRARIEQVAGETDTPPAPILRAMENLKLALRLRLSRGGLSDEQIRAVAAALDRAVGDIEQI